MKVNGNLKFRQLGAGELQNAVIERVNGGASGGTLPTGSAGRLVYNLDSNTYWWYNGTIWQEFGAEVNISNIITSGGYMNADGTFNPTPLNA